MKQNRWDTLQYITVGFLVFFILSGCKVVDSDLLGQRNVVTDEKTTCPEEQFYGEFTDVEVSALVEQRIFAPEKLSMPTERTPYKYGQADINGDGESELMVLIRDQYFCGTGGCSAYLFSSGGQILSRFTVSDTPVFVSEKKTHGWNDLIITSRGVQHVMRFDGKKYPLNPSVQPQITRDDVINKARAAAVQEEIYVQDGHNLRLTDGEDVPILSPYNKVMFSFDHYGDPMVTYRIDVLVQDGKAEVLPDTTFE